MTIRIKGSAVESSIIIINRNNEDRLAKVRLLLVLLSLYYTSLVSLSLAKYHVSANQLLSIHSPPFSKQMPCIAQISHTIPLMFQHFDPNSDS